MIHQPLLPDGVYPQISSSLNLLVLCLIRPDLFVIYYIFSENSFLSLAPLANAIPAFSTLWFFLYPFTVILAVPLNRIRRKKWRNPCSLIVVSAVLPLITLSNGINVSLLIVLRSKPDIILRFWGRIYDLSFLQIKVMISLSEKFTNSDNLTGWIFGFFMVEACLEIRKNTVLELRLKVYALLAKMKFPSSNLTYFRWIKSCPWRQ